ncbi:MAG: hypothetical protein ABIR33_13165 [Pyrinomonadaceae bacterium]
MKVVPSRKYLIYALIAFLCPIAAILVTILYQSIAHAEDWKLYGEELAGAYLALAEVIQIVYAVAIGSALGLIFAIISLRFRRRFISVGTAALTFNALPFVLTVYLLIQGITRGW